MLLYYFQYLGPPRPGMQPQGPVGQPRGPPPGMVIVIYNSVLLIIV